jgi:serine/threonine protein kinase
LVALKFCKEKEGFDSFLKEAALMTELPPHPNVVQMYGVSIDGPQPILVLEYCARGSLDKLLSEKARHLSENDKLDFVKGIARGMFHLHYHNIVHRDLAARNILLNEANVPKISDFGMSRIIKKDEEGEVYMTQKMILDQYVGCHLKQLERENTVRNPMYGHSGLSFGKL